MFDMIMVVKKGRMETFVLNRFIKIAIFYKYFILRMHVLRLVIIWDILLFKMIMDKEKYFTFENIWNTLHLKTNK